MGGRLGSGGRGKAELPKHPIPRGSVGSSRLTAAPLLGRKESLSAVPAESPSLARPESLAYPEPPAMARSGDSSDGQA